MTTRAKPGNTDNSFRINRRQVIVGLGLASTFSIVNSRALPTDVASRYVRMRSDEDGGPVMWVYGGVMLVKPYDQIARPIARMGGVGFTRAIERAPAVFDWQLDEVGYYLDLETGAVLDTMINPFTGNTVSPAHYNAPERLSFDGSKVRPRNTLPSNIEFKGEITRLTDVAGLSAMTEDMYLNISARSATDDTPARPARHLASLKTYTARTDDLDSGNRKWIDCQYTYSTMNTFASWLDMDGTPGVQNMRLVGTKCRLSDSGAIPKWFRVRVARDHPDFLGIPNSWI